MLDKYSSFAALAASEVAGADYRVNLLERLESGVLIIAPHGGRIELGTSELAALIAGEDYSLFAFEGLKSSGGSRDLHITSHNFDHPDCVALASRHPVVLGVHGCKGASSRAYIGGLDVQLRALLTERLSEAGFPATCEGHQYPGRNPRNICNRGARGRGAQIELTFDLRRPPTRALIATVTREVISEYLAGISPHRLPSLP